MKTRWVVLWLFVVSVGSTVPAFGATNTWLSGSGFWTATDNWTVPAEPTQVDDVFFDTVRDGVGGWVRLNGGPAGLQFRTARSITFLEGAGSYLLDGNTGGDKKELQIGEGGIVNGTTNIQVFNTQIFVSASQVWDAQSGNITAEDVVQLGGNTLTITGDNDVAINGGVSGDGDIFKDGAGMLTLSVSNTYMGDTILNSGTLTLLADQNLVGSLVLNGGLVNTSDQFLRFGTLLLAGDITLQLGDDGASQLLSFTDAIWSAGTLTIQGWTGEPDSDPTSDQVGVGIEPAQDFLSHVQFEGYPLGALWSEGLLLPIPEPSAPLLVGLGLIGLVAVQLYRRRGCGRQ